MFSWRNKENKLDFLFSGDEADDTAKLRKENKKLKKYIDKFKDELKGLDHVSLIVPTHEKNVLTQAF